MIDVVRKSPEQRGFDERTLAWLTAHRRPARNYERDPQFSEEMIRWAAINQMLRRIAPRQARRMTATPHPTTSPSCPL